MDFDELTPTEQKQRRASDPKASAFVAANAGSGKTYVLVRRILRLLLSGVDPSRILALTYTTAAAANMSIRVFKELSAWVNLDDEALSSELFKLDGKKPKVEQINFARQLFARSVETPGGLKIQTIHAFCERVLHLFPFEANVPAQFQILDDQTKSEFLTYARKRVLDKSQNNNPHLMAAIDCVIEETGEHGFETILADVLRYADKIKRHALSLPAIESVIKSVAASLNLDPDYTVEKIEAELFFERVSDLECYEIGNILTRSTSNDAKIGAVLIEALSLIGKPVWKQKYISAFLTADLEPRSDKGYITKTIREKFPNIYPLLAAERDRVAHLVELLKSAQALSRTKALLIVASEMIGFYEARKISTGMLDFEDLILRTRDLLNHAGAEWVLYKLDRGIDHVLIDEAQDTSPEQWEILKLLTSEFHVGEGARPNTRTIFAVGDPKQSIYSFQGAQPSAFSENRDLLKDQIGKIKTDASKAPSLFHDEMLTLSFRSTPAILQAVDIVFGSESNSEGLDHDGKPPIHESYRHSSPGFVEIWPPLSVEDNGPDENWSAPLDEPSRGSSPVLLARQIAEHIASLVNKASKERIEEAPGVFRPIIPGDILILVRKRGLFFETVIRALKDRQLPVAGADRLRLSEHIAIMDLVALGQSVLTPEDDLTLACVLKSPLFGFDEEQLLNVAAEREGSLLSALQSRDGNAEGKAASLKFADFQEAAKQIGPFGFYSYVLGACGGRRLFKSRLGVEADDAIDEFLRLALEHEQRETPSLARFLHGFLASETTVKRDMDSGRNEVRVMTVHGAKGLEAPIVYLPDTCGVSVDKTKVDPILTLSETEEIFLPVWSPSQSTDTLKMGEIRKSLYKKDAEEHRRLLYVAMTRPRDRLYIAGFLGKRKLTDDSWYAMIEMALGSAMTQVADGDGPPGTRRFQTIPYPDAGTHTKEAKPLQNIVVPEWLTRKPDQEKEALPPIRPSHAISAADRDQKTAGDVFHHEARRKGVLIHSLLELLPNVSSDRRMAVALDYFKVRGTNLNEIDPAKIVSNIIYLTERSEVSDLFSKQSKAEVAIAGLLKREGKPSRPVSGKIDRLAVLEKDVLIADFKTSSNPPGPLKPIPDQTVVQLATYRALVGDLYPRHKIRCFVIYTATLQIIEVPDEVLDAGLSLIE